MRPSLRHRPLLLVACPLLALAVWLGPGAPSAAAVDVTVSCSPEPADCGGWYRGPVTIDWSVFPSASPVIAGCQDRTLSTDTPGTTEYCAAGVPGDSASREKTLRVDQTPPSLVGATPARQPDGGGWYRTAVAVRFTGSDATSGIASCTATTFAGPDAAAASVPGSCRDVAGNTSATGSFGLRYDATPPDVTGAVADRPFDHDGWFNHPLGFTFTGADATSGLAACDPAGYDGPGGSAVEVTGTCRDRAGNSASRAFLLSYDAAPPALRKLSAEPADAEVRVRWAASRDTVAVEVRRAPGAAGAPVSVVYTGAAAGFLDRRVSNGTRYRYSVSAMDRAGNRARGEASATPGRRLLAPAARARRAKPPLLRWTRTRGARFYNVQLHRDGRKILSAWPARARLRLRRSWAYRGRRHRLVPAQYTWYVWPARGSRAHPRFGRLIGRRTFVVTR